MRFKAARGGGVTADVSEVEQAVLASSVAQLLHLLTADDDATVVDDPIAAMVGLPPGEVQRPDDPALARLLPDAYRPDASADPSFDAEEAASDFRRYTEGELRGGKRAQAVVVLRSVTALGDRGGRLRLDRAGADAWLGTLNDLRLALGVRLGVTGDAQPQPQDEDTAHSLQVFSWLGWLQESLLDCLDPLPPG